jgi:uncharacterized protein DUF6114
MMRTARPAGPFLFALFGGVLILANGIVVIWIGAAAFAEHLGDLAASIDTLGVFECTLGVVVILLATVFFMDPRYPFGYGVAIIALSLLSYFGGGGFLLGLALGLIGGIWTLWVEPSVSEAPKAEPVEARTDRICLDCSRRYSGTLTHCPFCGAAAP